MLLTLAAAQRPGLADGSVVIDGRWLGRAEDGSARPGRLGRGPGPAGRLPVRRVDDPRARQPTAYREAGSWLARKKAGDHGKVLGPDRTGPSYSARPPGMRASVREHPVGRRRPVPPAGSSSAMPTSRDTGITAGCSRISSATRAGGDVPRTRGLAGQGLHLRPPHPPAVASRRNRRGRGDKTGGS